MRNSITNSLILFALMSLAPAIGHSTPPKTLCDNALSNVVSMADFAYLREQKKMTGSPTPSSTASVHDINTAKKIVSDFKTTPVESDTQSNDSDVEEVLNEVEAGLILQGRPSSPFDVIGAAMDRLFGPSYNERIELLRQDLANPELKFETLLSWLRTRQPEKIPAGYSNEFAQRFITTGFDFNKKPQAWFDALQRMKVFLPQLQAKLELDQDFDLEGFMAVDLYFSIRGYLTGSEILNFINWFMSQNNYELAHSILLNATNDNYALRKLKDVELRLFQLIDRLTAANQMTVEQAQHMKTIFQNRTADL